jgi:Plasmid replication region DNA-binding N-term
VENSTHPTPSSESDYFSRREALRQRVAEAARALADRGISPTVARVRAALGGGSPNDLAPALKQWKESFAPAPTSGSRTDTPAIPVQISDLAQELWQRATIAAAVELKGGPTARALNTRTEEAEALRQQMKSLRDQLERESMMYGELRAQAARHEAIARDTLARLDESEARARKHLRELGSMRQRVAELEATLTQRRERTAAAVHAHPSALKASSPKRSRRKAVATPPRPSPRARAPKGTAAPRGQKRRKPSPSAARAKKGRRTTRIKPRSRR